MDILSIVKEKCKTFAGTSSELGLDAVIHHIEIAERHFDQGRVSGDYLYTDVIYRTNQAFEGALKEGYRVLAGCAPSQKKPFEIENHFGVKGVLKGRVLSQFTTYRKEWRNQSTHDYQLLFSSQEALLAIVSVSAFFNILLDQMLETHGFEMEKMRLEKMSKSLFADVENFDQLEFMQKCTEILSHFWSELKSDSQNTLAYSEYELLGRMAGFVAAADKNIKITTDKVIEAGSRTARIDLYLEKDNRTVIVEVRTAKGIEWRRRSREGVMQAKIYLAALGKSEAIVFVGPRNSDDEIALSDMREELGGVVNSIVLIAPK